MIEKDYEKEVLQALSKWICEGKGYVTKELACTVEEYLEENNCNAPNPLLKVTYRLNACKRLKTLCNGLYTLKEMRLISNSLEQIARFDY